MSSNNLYDDQSMTATTLVIGQSSKHSTMELSEFDNRFSLSGAGDMKIKS